MIGAVSDYVGIWGTASGWMSLSVHAARSIVRSSGLVGSVRQPSIFRIEIWPDAIRAQNSIAAVSADGSTVWVLMRRLNSSCRRSMAFVVLALFHWLGGSRVKAIGEAARLEMEAAFGRRVHLFLHVKVKPGWGDDRQSWRDLGLDWVD